MLYVVSNGVVWSRHSFSKTAIAKAKALTKRWAVNHYQFFVANIHGIWRPGDGPAAYRYRSLAGPF